jgi:hypothetical protein
MGAERPSQLLPGRHHTRSICENPGHAGTRCRAFRWHGHQAGPRRRDADGRRAPLGARCGAVRDVGIEGPAGALPLGRLLAALRLPPERTRRCSLEARRSGEDSPVWEWPTATEQTRVTASVASRTREMSRTLEVSPSRAATSRLPGSLRRKQRRAELIPLAQAVRGGWLRVEEQSIGWCGGGVDKRTRGHCDAGKPQFAA